MKRSLDTTAPRFCSIHREPADLDEAVAEFLLRIVEKRKQQPQG